ncbi:MAG: NAD-dependent dihydropyrimidine dehydrogenase subunit PreA [Eubacteriales bacterium]|nr:NAD-dependent dihydropyrimidine dehydrogenase subunit PreA [Eubacteriales bacterium]
MLLQRIIPRKDMIACALCKDAPCSAACGKLDCARLLRAIWFDNEQGVTLPKEIPCISCNAPCEQACVFAGQVPVKRLVTRLMEERRNEEPPAFNKRILQTDLCGIPMENPFMLSSSVVASTYDMCARAFDMGWAGAAFKTVCMMDIHEVSPRYSALKGNDGVIVGFKNIEQLSDHTLSENLHIFRKLKENYPSKLLLVSIMGRDEEEWTRLAQMVTQAGADAIELNFSCPNMAENGLGSDVGQIPELVERFTAAARKGSSIPILAKLTPNVASMRPMAQAALRGGADGLAAINTIKSIVSVNPHTYVSEPSVHGLSSVGGYSGAAVKPIALRFMEELARVAEGSNAHISGMGGVETWRDALEFLMLGAKSIQITTAVMQYGYRIIDDLISGLGAYLADKGLSSVGEIVGVGVNAVEETENLERDSILYPTFIRKNCVGCGRCAISCRDGGHDAIGFDASRKPTLNPNHCVGCHLCALVCPTSAIRSSGKRVLR